MRVASCDWVVDGESTPNASTLTLNPDSVRTYEVELTVSDASGNSANTSATITSVDPSVPYFEEGYLDLFPTKATEGDELTSEVAVDDDYDGLVELRGSLGPPTEQRHRWYRRRQDDAGRSALIPRFFTQPGLQDIVITVFDASNNSATHAFCERQGHANRHTAFGNGGAYGRCSHLGGCCRTGGVPYHSAKQGLQPLDSARPHRRRGAPTWRRWPNKARSALFAPAEVHAGLDVGVDVVCRGASSRSSSPRWRPSTARRPAGSQRRLCTPGLQPTTALPSQQPAAAVAAALLSGDEDIMAGGDR